MNNFFHKFHIMKIYLNIYNNLFIYILFINLELFINILVYIQYIQNLIYLIILLFHIFNNFLFYLLVNYKNKNLMVNIILNELNLKNQIIILVLNQRVLFLIFFAMYNEQHYHQNKKNMINIFIYNY